MMVQSGKNMQRAKRKMQIKQFFKKLAGLAVLVAFCGQTWAVAGVIQAISSGEQSGEILLKVDLSEKLSTDPIGFTTQSPARVAIDLPGVSNGTGKSLIELNQGNLRSVAIAEANNRTRLILNLNRATAFTTEVADKTLYIRLTEPNVEAVSTTAVATTQKPSESSAGRVQSADAMTVRDIDFRPSTDGAGALIITLPSDQTQVNVHPQTDQVIVDIQQARLPDALRRVLDVSDFQTPMRMIKPEQSGNNVRLVVSAKGYWDSSSYQAQNQFVLELHPVKDSTSKATPGEAYRGEKLTLSFQNVDIRMLLRSIAEFTDFNVIVSESVQGNLTLHLRDVPWDHALEIILQSRGLALYKTGNVLWIAPRDEIQDLQVTKLEDEQENEALAPLRTQVFQLNYTNSEQFMEALNSADKGSIVSDRGSIIVDPRTNKLIVTDTTSRIENITRIIQEVDIPVRQVMIEARIIIASDGWGRNIGMRLSGNFKGHNKWMMGGTMPSEEDSSSGDDNSNKWSNKKDIYNFFNLPASAIGGVQPSYFAFQFAQSAGQYLQLEIQALEQENYGRSIASPSLTTLDMKTARVEQGVELPYLEASSSGAVTVAYKKAVISLEVTPRITPTGDVDMDIYVSQDKRGEMTPWGFGIDTQRVETSVTVENGGTIVIGGIYQEEEETIKTKIPLLGDIPLLGEFFRSTNNSSKRTEMLVFISPKIVQEGAYYR